MKISQLVESYLAVLPIGCVLTEEQITRSLRAAVRKYCGYAHLMLALDADGSKIAIDATDTALGAQDFDLTASEVSVIKPLWHLYMELENSTALEASRSMGAELFGRTTPEVQQAIEGYEMRLPALVFKYEVFSI